MNEVNITKEDQDYDRAAAMAEYILDFVDTFGPLVQYIKGKYS
jgi:hypothetical protein